MQLMERNSLFLGATWPLISRVKAFQAQSPAVRRVRATTSPTCVCFGLPGYIAAGASVPENAAMWNKSCGSPWFSRGQDPEGVLIVISSPCGLSTVLYEVRAVLWGATYGRSCISLGYCNSNDIWYEVNFIFMVPFSVTLY